MSGPHHAPRRLAWLVLLAAVWGLRPVAVRAEDDWATSKKAFSKAQKSIDWKVRNAGWADLSYHDSADAASEALSALAREEHPAVLLTAIRTISAFGSKGAKEVLISAARKGKDPVRLYVLLALSDQPGDAAKDVLLELLATHEGPACAQAALALGKRRIQEAQPHLLALLSHKDWRLRAAGARGLRFLAGEIPVAQPGKPPPPATPAALLTTDVLNALVDAFESGQNRDRADALATLERLTQQRFGVDLPAWRALASGVKPADIARNPQPAALIAGVPVLGRRVVILSDNNTRTEDVVPFDDTRLRELCKVPGGRDIPPFRIKTLKDFINAHVKRLISDLPDGTLFDLLVMGGKPRDVFGRLTPANGGTRQAAITVLEEAKVEASNDTFTALDQALDISGRKDSVAWDVGPEEIVYVAVAVPWRAEQTDATVVAAAIGLKARLRMVAISTVGVAEHPYELCRSLAEQTGGTYVDLTK